MKNETWYWEDLWTGKKYWEENGVVYEVLIDEDGYVKLEETQSLKGSVNE